MILLLIRLALIAPIVLSYVPHLITSTNYDIRPSPTSTIKSSISDEEVTRLWNDLSTETGNDSQKTPITAEEVVLACYASFKRKNRRPKGELLSKKDTDGCGYFWDDVSELKDLDEDKEPIDTFIPFEEPKLDDPSFPDRPSESSQRYSAAAKAKFSDEEWKASWYTKRWGDPSNHSNKISASVQSRINKISTDMLNSPELLSLSESEIADAIKVYLSSREKRSRSHKLRYSDKEAWFNETLLPVFEEYQYSTSLEGLAKKRQTRANKARKAYQTRISNQKTKHRLDAVNISSYEQNSTFTSTISTSSELSVYDLAIARIYGSLQNNKIPSIADLDLVLTPKRLSGRRPLLLKILKKTFGLSGKCILIPDTNQYCFSSTCNIQLLGSFIREKLVLHCEK